MIVRFFLLISVYLCVALSNGLAWAQSQPPATSPVSEPSPTVMGEYKIGHFCDHLMIPVTWNGKPGYFLLDTGAAYSVVDAKEFASLTVVAPSLGVDAVGGHHEITTCDPPEISVGPFALSRCGAVVRTDLSNIRAATGRRVIGILGVPAFNDTILQIDFDARKFRFLQLDWKLHPEWGKDFKMVLGPEGKMPRVHLSVDGVEQNLVVDSGSNGFLELPTTEFNLLRERKKAALEIYPSAVLAEMAQLGSSRIPDLEIAGLHFRDAKVGETKSPSGFIGLGFLERHVVTMDFAGHHLYLKKGNEFEREAREYISGLSIVRPERELLVYSVHPGSAAEKAGLKTGDVILEVNGKVSADSELYDLTDLLHSDKIRELSIKYQRDGVAKTVKFQLQLAP